MFVYRSHVYRRQQRDIQSAMSDQYFGKRVSLGAQAAAFSYLALETRNTSIIRAKRVSN